jgi:hypothetical protein
MEAEQGNSFTCVVCVDIERLRGANSKFFMICARSIMRDHPAHPTYSVYKATSLYAKFAKTLDKRSSMFKIIYESRSITKVKLIGLFPSRSIPKRTIPSRTRVALALRNW